MEESRRVKVNQNFDSFEELTKQYAIHWTLNEVWKHTGILWLYYLCHITYHKASALTASACDILALGGAVESNDTLDIL